MGSYPEGVITDPCDGDSGGPLAILRDGRWQLVGVLKVIRDFPENWWNPECIIRARGTTAEETPSTGTVCGATWPGNESGSRVRWWTASP